jgi:hypothetical protein
MFSLCTVEGCSDGVSVFSMVSWASTHLTRTIITKGLLIMPMIYQRSSTPNCPLPINRAHSNERIYARQAGDTVERAPPPGALLGPANAPY